MQSWHSTLILQNCMSHVKIRLVSSLPENYYMSKRLICFKKVSAIVQCRTGQSSFTWTLTEYFYAVKDVCFWLECLHFERLENMSFFYLSAQAARKSSITYIGLIFLFTTIFLFFGTAVWVKSHSCNTMPTFMKILLQSALWDSKYFNLLQTKHHVFIFF